MTTAMPVTGAPFETPWETPTFRFGQGGIRLDLASDQLAPADAAVMTNLRHDLSGFAEVRFGQTQLATLSGVVHSIGRLNNVQAGTFTRVWGAGSGLYVGQTGSPSSVDSGYSGNPLAIVPYRPALSATAWAYLGDSLKMNKVRDDGLVIPIGLPAPSSAVSVTVEAAYTTPVANFDGNDGTQASSWFGNAGQDHGTNDDGSPNVHPSDAPLISDETGPEGGAFGGSVRMELAGSMCTTGYDSWMSRAKTIDLSVLQSPSSGDTRAANDDDLMHVWLKLSHPWRLNELRLYLVCDAVFDTSVIPGLVSGANVDAYVKAFRPADFTAFISTAQTAVDAAQTARTRAALDADLRRRAKDPDTPIDELTAVAARALEITDPKRQQTVELGAGAEQWMEYGVIGLPLRRSDFVRIGNSPDRGWNTITGIVIYVSTNTTDGLAVEFDDWHLTGGSGPDDSEPGDQPYDWRYTHYDTRTGAEGNPSNEMTAGIDLARQGATLDPDTYGDAAIRQRFYRRGGTLVDDWYFCGQNDADGANFLDRSSDALISGEDTLALNHDQPVTTQDADGNTVHAQPCPVLFGPIQDQLFAAGDPYRPGLVYYCIPGEPDHWPPDHYIEVCSPSEQVMNGGIFGGQGFVFSKTRLYWIYPNLTNNGTVTSAPTGCKKGIAARWFFCIGRAGIYFGNADGIFLTRGDDPQLISKALTPLFRGQTTNGYQPIDFTHPEALRLDVFQHELWFAYQDTNGDRQILICSLFGDPIWYAYDFGNDVAAPVAESVGDDGILLLGSTNGSAYLYDVEAFDDAGTAIDWRYRTGAQDMGAPRNTKLFGDIIVDADPGDAIIEMQARINTDDVIESTSNIEAATGRARYILNPFGADPQQGRTIALNFAGTASTARPRLYQAGVAISPQPDTITTRPTLWDDGGHAYEKYLTGVVIEANTNGADVTLAVEYDLGGAVAVAAEVTLNCDGRHKQYFSWLGPSGSIGAVKANLMRIRPISCDPWILYKVDWIFDKEPPRIAKWDSNVEDLGDSYYTGLDLDIDTLGVTKQIEVWIDGTRITNPATGLSYFSVSTPGGRRYVHLSFGPARGHLYRFVAIDSNDGLLYSHKWWVEKEPSEQTNWNQNFQIGGTLSDKWVKGIAIECDTFGADKTVEIQVDDTVAATLTVNTTERRVKHFSFPKVRGRVLRILPTDFNAGRFYSASLIFDEEPLELPLWETQELDFGLPGWKSVVAAHVCLRSSSPVTLTMRFRRAEGEAASVTTQTYAIASTAGAKQIVFVPCQANKGVLYDFQLEATPDDQSDATGFWLYREESWLDVQPWADDSPVIRRSFGNDDLDGVRAMQRADLTASREGGGVRDYEN